MEQIREAIVGCTRCPRLVTWRESVAAAPPPRFAGERYWARPVPGFGDPAARMAIIALATAAHGGNRTGRALTGNSSADWLMPALHRAGLASRPTSEHAGDGLELRDVWLASAVRCPPPKNKPSPAERDACAPFLRDELAALDGLRVIVALGAFAWAALTRALDARPRPRFEHGAETTLPGGTRLLGCYHPSPQNTQTGVLTEAMLDEVIARATMLARDAPER